MFKGIDLFSDTATKPSAAMKQAMMEALLGDEQLGEDPTTKKLETMMAERLGKSCALFFPSATMANQIAVKLHTEPGDEVIAHEHCHIFNAEGGGAAFHSHVQARMIPSKSGIFGADEVRLRFRDRPSPNSPKTGLLIVENTTNAGGGCAWPLAMLQEVTDYAKSKGIKSHLDGSRLFNAAVKTECDAAHLAAGFDSITICFSKGLGCPSGAVLAFDAKDFARVRKLKQIFGGAMRQSGMLAGAALFALEHHLPDLAQDHEKATRLAQGLAKIPGILVEDLNPSTNMVFFSLAPQGGDPAAFNELTKARGLRFSCFDENRFRAVSHRDLSMADIEKALEIVADIVV
jgi:threonine aldolase